MKKSGTGLTFILSHKGQIYHWQYSLMPKKGTSLTTTTEDALRSELRRVGTPSAQKVLADADAFSYMVRMFNGTLAMGKGEFDLIAMAAVAKSMATRQGISWAGWW